MKTQFVNEIYLTLKVSNDTEKRKSIYKVSDKLTTIKAFLNTGKNQEGAYNPPIDFEVQVFTASSKNPTKVTNAINPGDYINVKGRLTSKLTKNAEGREFKNFIIAASEITPPELMEESSFVPEGFTPVNTEESPWNQ